MYHNFLHTEPKKNGKVSQLLEESVIRDFTLTSSHHLYERRLVLLRTRAFLAGRCFVTQNISEI